MIDNADYKQESLDENVRVVVSTLRDFASSLVLAIQNQIDDEKLMFLCLGINEDIQKTFDRYDMFKKKIKPCNFASSFLSDYSSCNIMKSTGINNVSNDNNNNSNSDNFNFDNNLTKDNNPNNFSDFFNNSSTNSKASSNQNQNNLNNANNTDNDDGKKYAKELNDIFG